MRKFTIRFLTPLALASCLAGNAWSQSAEDYVSSCLGASSKTQCEATKKDFLGWFPKAMKGDYQAQRNVSFCLSTGCSGAIIKNPMAGCAWRAIILASGSTKVDVSDTANFQTYCGKLETVERATAIAQAEAFFPNIYKRPMPGGFR